MTASYARPTAASRLRADSATESSYEASHYSRRPSLVPSTLKRRSTRLPIEPLDRKKPCPIALLPLELHLEIFSYLITDAEVDIDTDRPWPPYLRVCRTIRNAAACVYYSHTKFVCRVGNLHFDGLEIWLRRLPVAHKAFLARNRHLTINLMLPRSRLSYTALVRNHTNRERWKECRDFGNYYAVTCKHRLTHKVHFVCYCRLARWFLCCAKQEHRDIKWRYAFKNRAHHQWNLDPMPKAYVTLSEAMGGFACKCLREAGVDQDQKTATSKEALNLLNQVDEAIERLDERESLGHGEEAATNTGRLRKHFLHWEKLETHRIGN